MGEIAPVAEAWKEVEEMGGDLDDSRLPAEFGYLSGVTADEIPIEATAKVEALAEVRKVGEKEVVRVVVTAPTLENIFREVGEGEIVRLGVRRVGRG